jgi:hypothetical protein
MEYMEEDRPSGPYEPDPAKAFWGGVVMVERLLDREGTSSTDILTAGPGSPKVNDRVSVPEDVAVPSLGVLRDTWLLLNP